MKNYKVKWCFIGFGIKGATIFMEAMKNDFAIGYNRFCDLVNPMYETWNKLYDDTFGDTFTDADGCVTEHYEKWIKEKIDEEVIPKLNGTILDFTYGDGGEPMLFGHLKGAPQTKVCFYLEEA